MAQTSFQARFITKQTSISVNEPILDLDSSVSTENLNTIIKALIKESTHISDEDKPILETSSFEFIVGGRLLRQSIDQHLEIYIDDINAEEVLNERILDIEYFIAAEAPKPIDAITTDDWVSCVSANESYIICGCYDNSLHIWSLKDLKDYVKRNKEQGLPRSYQLLNIKNAQGAPISGVRWLPTTKDDLSIPGFKPNEDFLFVSCGHDEVAIVRKWSPKSKEVTTVATLKGHTRSVNCIDFHSDLIATGSYDQTLRIWSLDMKQGIRNDEDQLDSGAADCGDSTANEADQVASATSEKNPSKNKAASNNKQQSNAKSKKQKTKLGLESSHMPTRVPVVTLTGHSESITGVRWLNSLHDTSEENLVTCSMDNTICIWDVEVGACKRKLVSSKPMLDIDYSAHNRLLVTASCDRHVRLWDSRIPGSSNAISTVKAAYTSHNAWVSSVAFSQNSHNSNLFISGGYDNLVKQWDLRSPKASLFDLIGHHDRVLCVDWSNKDFILSGSADNNVKIFGC